MSVFADEPGARLALDRQERDPSALRAAARRATSAWALALAVVLAALLHDTLGGRLWLTQVDALLEFEPWVQAAPEDFRPGNPLLLDQSLVVHPWLEFARRELLAGRLPLWNPDAYLGQPIHAAYTGAFLWPLNWIYLASGSWAAWAWIAWFKLFLTAVGMLLLLRRLGLSASASAVGALGFTLCGFNVAWLGHPHTNVSMLLPWAVLAIEGAIARPSAARAVPVALVAALIGVGGHVQTATHCGLVLGAWVLARTVVSVGAERRVGPGALATLAGGALAGAALAAPALTHFLEYVEHSRAQVLFEAREATAPVAFSEAAVLLFDHDHHGDPRHGNYTGPEGDHLNFNELIGPFVGVGMLVLATAGAIARRRDGRVRFLVLLAAASLAITWQLPPLWDLLRDVPHLRSTKLMRFGLFAAFALSSLGAFGLDHWRGRCETERGRRSLSLLAFAIVALELLEFGRGYNPAADPAHVLPNTPTVEFLTAAEESAALDDGPGRVLGTEGTTLFPNAHLFHGLAMPTGYDSIEDEAMAELVGLLTTDARAQLFVKEIAYFDRAIPLADLLGLRWILSRQAVPGLEEVHRSPTGLRLYANPGALPRVFLAERVVVEPDPAARLAGLGSAELEPRTAWVASADGAVDPGAVAAGGSLTLLEHRPGLVRAAVESDAPELLVLTETHDPGWRVEVDGRRFPVQRVDHALSGVWLQPGAHQVEFRYAPDSWRRGLLWAALGAVGLAAAALLEVRLARRR